MTGTQNVGLDGLVLTGSISYWAQPDRLLPTWNLWIYNCRFQDLTSAYYASIGLLDGIRNVTIDNCTFTNLGYSTSGTAQFICGSHNVLDVHVLNRSFADCRGDYVWFRDNSEYCTGSNCLFHFIIRATAFPFITSPLYYSTDPGPGEDFFGIYFHICSKSFTYDVSACIYAGIQFSHTGYAPRSYDCALTPVLVSDLSSGTTSFKHSFLQTNMGIIASDIRMCGNILTNVTYDMVYTYNYSIVAIGVPHNGWQGTINISDVLNSSGALLGPAPKLRNADFDKRGFLLLPVPSSTPNECRFQTWFANPKYASIYWHPGFDGTANALRFDRTVNQCVYQWISGPTPKWSMDCLFAIGSGSSGTGTKFKVDIIHNDIAGSKASVGVDSMGYFGIYNGGAFTMLPELGTIDFSVDTNGNGNYTNPGDSLYIYHLRIIGNYDAAAPYVNVYTSDANSLALTHHSLDLTDWVNGAPVSGQSAPGTIAFYNYTAPVLLDQVAFTAGLKDQPPAVNKVSMIGGSFVCSGTSGFAEQTYVLLSSTNLALPLNHWVRESTNMFDRTGSFTITNTVLPGTLQTFYRLHIQ